MLNAAIDALSQMLTAPLRRVLLKSVGLALLLILLIGIGLQRTLSVLADNGANWAEQASGVAPHALWSALATVLSIIASLGIFTGALFLMPAVTAFVGSFFVDEIAEIVEREHYPAEPLGSALPVFIALMEGIKFAILALLVYMIALPFLLLAGLGLFVLFFANAYLLGREYFELAAMRFRSPDEARALRKSHAGYIFASGMVIALFISIPILNLATPIFAMAFMVHVHKKLFGGRAELIEPEWRRLQ
jgi:CysZ protein